MRGSLLGMMRASIALCLLASVGALAGKWGLLSQTERRAAELSAQITPLVERIQVVPEIVTGLQEALQLVPNSMSAGQVETLDRRIHALLARTTLPQEREVPPLPTLFSSLIVLQGQVVEERGEINAIFLAQSLRLEEIAARLNAVLSQAVLSLAGADPDPRGDAASGSPSHPRTAPPGSRAAAARRVAALAGAEAALSGLIIHTKNVGHAAPEAALALKPPIVREVDNLTSHLSRLTPGPERQAIAADMAAYRRAILGPGNAFARTRALQAVEASRDAVASEVKTRLDLLSAWSETSAAEAATAFRQAAEANRVTVGYLRNFDVIAGVVFWLGCIVLLWVLVERKLFARIEALVAHKREMAAGNMSRPVTIGGEDELGELEHAVERSRLTAGALADANAQLHAVLDGAPDGILTVSEDAIIVDANPAVTKMFGYDARELIGQPVDILMPVRDRGRHRELIRRTRAGDLALRVMAQRDVVGLRRDGREFPLEVSLSLAETSGHKLFIGMLRDISSRKEAEDQLLAALDELERSNADLDNFAYVASHDLKAPLRVIDNASGWLEEDLAEYLTDDTRESMELLRGRVRRMEKLLDDLLAYSRVGRVKEASRMVTGTELIEDVCALTNLPEGFTIETEGDFEGLRVQNMPLRNVLLNLVSNALKHHDRDHGTVRISVEDLGDQLRFAVADDGPGIAPEFHERVLRMFHTLRPRDEVEGSGMGLAMVKKYVEVAGGRLEIDSDGDRGTRFRFTWPKGALTVQEGEAA